MDGSWKQHWALELCSTPLKAKAFPANLLGGYDDEI